jgi:hypothetical protein
MRRPRLNRRLALLAAVLTGTTHPEYDDDPDFAIPAWPATRAEALAAGWTLVGNFTGTSTVDLPAERDYFSYIAFAFDDAGNYAPAGDGSHDRTLDHWLDNRMKSDGNVICYWDYDCFLEAPPTMRPARHVHKAARRMAHQRRVHHVSIGLQITTVVCQHFFRAIPAAAGPEVVEHVAVVGGDDAEQLDNRREPAHGHELLDLESLQRRAAELLPAVDVVAHPGERRRHLPVR